MFWILLAATFSVDLSDIGVTYDSEAAAADNSAAIDTYLSSLPPHSATLLDHTGTVYLSNTLRLPGNKSVSWRGHYGVSRLYHTGNGPGVLFSQSSSDIRRAPLHGKSPSSFTGVAILGRGRGAGLQLKWYGPNFVVRDVQIQDFAIGLMATQHTGGWIDNVHVTHNETGAVFESCHQTRIELLSRENTARGVGLVDCSSLRGSLYVESNGGLGIEADGLRASNLQVYMEGNRRHGLGQAKLANSSSNTWFVNQLQAASYNYWSMAPSDCLTNRFPNETPDVVNARNLGTLEHAGFNFDADTDGIHYLGHTEGFESYRVDQGALSRTRWDANAALKLRGTSYPSRLDYEVDDGFAFKVEMLSDDSPYHTERMFGDDPEPGAIVTMISAANRLHFPHSSLTGIYPRQTAWLTAAAVSRGAFQPYLRFRPGWEISAESPSRQYDFKVRITAYHLGIAP